MNENNLMDYFSFCFVSFLNLLKKGILYDLHTHAKYSITTQLRDGGHDTQLDQGNINILWLQL